VSNSWSIVIVALLLALVLLVGYLLFFNIRVRPVMPRKEGSPEQALIGELDLGSLPLPEIREELPGAIGQQDLLVVVNPDDGARVIVFGDQDHASAFGEVVGPVPRQLAAIAVGADVLLKAGAAVGQQTGMLVRLTPESTRRLGELKSSVDASGAVLAVLRGSSGKFSHVVRFKPAVGLQALSGVTGILSAVAMQAQLAALERSLARMAEDVRRIQETLSIQSTSRLMGTAEILQDVYRSANATGMLTRSSWEQVAPLGVHVFTNRDYSARHLQRLLDELHGLTSFADKRRWFERNEVLFIEAMCQLEEAERAVIQYSVLRLWWLMRTADPGLSHYMEDLNSRLIVRMDRKRTVDENVKEVLAATANTTWLDRLVSPFDSRATVRSAEDLLHALADSGLLTVPTGRSELTAESADPSDAKGADELAEGESTP